MVCPTHNEVRLRGLLRSYPVNSTVEITFEHDGKEPTTTAELAPLQFGSLGITYSARGDPRFEYKFTQ